MAQETDAELQARRAIIENANTPNSNTATRVGDMFENIIDSKVHNDKLRLTRTVTGNDAITQADDNALIIFNSASPIDFTVDSLTTDTKSSFINIGAGIVTFVNGAGVTIAGDTTLAAAADPSFPTAVLFYLTSTGPILVVGAEAASGSGHTIEEEGSPLTQRTKLNFVGAGVTVTDDSGDDATVVTVTSGSGHVIEDEGTPVTQRNNMNFVGAGVAVTDAGGKTVVTISGSGGITAATQAEMVTGTDNTITATPLSVESKRSIKLASFSNNATGSSTVDCGSKQEVCVLYTVTVTGAITIALSNATNLELLNIIIPITGSNIGITTPSTTRMSRYVEVSSGDGWYQSTKILQVSSVGTADLHELSFKKAGSVFILRYDGPVRA